MNREDASKILEAIIPYFYRSIRAEKSVFCKKFRLTPTQLDVLVALKDENLNLSRLSECTFLDSSTLVGTVDRLEKRHLLLKKVSSRDRRQNIISLTTKGRKLLDSIPVFESPLLKQAIEGLEEDERLQFTSAMEKILVNLKLMELIPVNSNSSGKIKPVSIGTGRNNSEISTIL